MNFYFTDSLLLTNTCYMFQDNNNNNNDNNNNNNNSFLFQRISISLFRFNSFFVTRRLCVGRPPGAVVFPAFSISEFKIIVIIIIIPGTVTIFMCCHHDTCHFESSPGSTDDYQAATDPQTRPADLGCESACRLLYGLHPQY